MRDAIAGAVGLWFFYLGLLWFLAACRENRLERRHYYDPPTGGPWVRPRGRYEKDLPH